MKNIEDGQLPIKIGGYLLEILDPIVKIELLLLLILVITSWLGMEIILIVQ